MHSQPPSQHSAPDPTPAVNPHDASLLLSRAAAGDTDAANSLLPLVYEQLRRAAQIKMASERTGHTLAATALVHEAYLKLAGPRDIPWQNRAHFYAAAAEAMRQILIDHAKSRSRKKRGGELGKIQLEAAEIPLAQNAQSNQTDFVALDAAIRRLEARDSRGAQVVRLKYFAGLEIAQVALVLGVSERTVKNDWAFAKAWLERTLTNEQTSDTEQANDQPTTQANDQT